jgi:hypothetical protein
VMTQMLKQREPGPAALKKGVESLVAGMNARGPRRWMVLSPPDGLKDDGVVAVGIWRTIPESN